MPRHYNTLRLSPGRRRKIRRKAQRGARREVGRERQRAQRQIGRVESRTQRRVGKVLGGVRRDAARIAATPVPKGLRGQARQQFLAERAGAARSTRQATGFFAAPLRQQGRQQVRQLRSGIPDVRDVTRQRFESAVKTARDQKAKQLVDRQKKREERAEMAAEIKAARERGMRLVGQVPLGEIASMQDPTVRGKLATNIARVEGIGSTAARRATRQLYREFVLPQIQQTATRTPTELQQTLGTEEFLRRRRGR